MSYRRKIPSVDYLGPALNGGLQIAGTAAKYSADKYRLDQIAKATKPTYAYT